MRRLQGVGHPSRRGQWIAALSVAAALAATGPAACGSATPTTSPPHAGRGTQSRTVAHGDLRVTLRGPAAAVAGSVVHLTARWDDTRAVGSVGPASIGYGDGTGEVFVQARFCRSSPVPVRSSQEFVHRFGGPGAYRITVTVADGCSVAGRATVHLRLIVTG